MRAVRYLRAVQEYMPVQRCGTHRNRQRSTLTKSFTDMILWPERLALQHRQAASVRLYVDGANIIAHIQLSGRVVAPARPITPTSALQSYGGPPRRRRRPRGQMSVMCRHVCARSGPRWPRLSGEERGQRMNSGGTYIWTRGRMIFVCLVGERPLGR